MKRAKIFRVSFVMLLFMFVNLSGIAVIASPFVIVRQNNVIRLGLRLLPESKTAVTESDIEKTMAIVRSRIEKLSGITITVERSQISGEEIAVYIPASLPLEQIKEAIINPGHLELKLLARNTEFTYATKEAAEKAAEKLNQASYEILSYNGRQKVNDKQTGWIVVERKSVIIAADIQEAKAVMSSYSNVIYEIGFWLKPESALSFGKLTGEHIGDSLAIVLNGEVKSVPRIQSRISTQGQISGNFTKQEAEKLAAILSSGELPHELNIVTEMIIPAPPQNNEQMFETTLNNSSMALFHCNFATAENR